MRTTALLVLFALFLMTPAAASAQALEEGTRAQSGAVVYASDQESEVLTEDEGDADSDLSWLHGTWVVSRNATLELLPPERRLMYSAMLATLSASVTVGDGTFSGQATFLSEAYADSGSWSGVGTGEGSATVTAQALGQTHTLAVSSCGDGCLVVAGNGERAVLVRVGE